MTSLRSVLAPLNLTPVRGPETFAQIPDQGLRRQASRALIVSHHRAHRRTMQPHGYTDGVLRYTGNGVYQAYSGGHIELTTLTSADLSGLPAGSTRALLFRSGLLN